MLGSADETPYDLRFSLLGIPVRVHPMFWLIMLLLGSGARDLRTIAIFVLCAFFSILVHEMGHGLSARSMGDEPLGIVLYGMGGYCMFDPHGLSRWRRIFVLLCGPGAGFLLYGLVLAFERAGKLPPSRGMFEATFYLLQINLVWGILNL